MATTILDTEVWKLEASCRGIDPELFYPEEDELSQAAQETCRGCMVRLPCLEYAMDTRQDLGVWGGLTPDERDHLRRLRVRQARAGKPLSVPDVPVPKPPPPVIATSKKERVVHVGQALGDRVKALLRERGNVIEDSSGGTVLILLKLLDLPLKYRGRLGKTLVKMEGKGEVRRVIKGQGLTKLRLLPSAEEEAKIKGSIAASDEAQASA